MLKVKVVHFNSAFANWIWKNYIFPIDCLTSELQCQKMYHQTCTQQRLRSDCANLLLMHFFMWGNRDSDHSAWIHRLIWVFLRHLCQEILLVTLQLLRISGVDDDQLQDDQEADESDEEDNVDVPLDMTKAAFDMSLNKVTKHSLDAYVS